MEPLAILGLYAVALVISSMAGGSLPQRITMTHTRTQLAMSLVSGLMLGIAFFHLLPHAVLTLGGERGINDTMIWTVVGLVTMLLLLRLLHFHQPDYPAVLGGDCEHEHEESIAAMPAGQEPPPIRWKGVLVGLTFHTFVDGVALGAALLATPHGHSEELIGFGVFLAILFHKPLDAMSITALMKAGGASARAQGTANLLFALVCPLGALLFYGYAMGMDSSAGELIAAALAFSAGAFVCIALSDLVPEVQFHSHDRVKLTVVFILGIAVSYLMANATPEHSHGLVMSLSQR